MNRGRERQACFLKGGGRENQAEETPSVAKSLLYVRGGKKKVFTAEGGRIFSVKKLSATGKMSPGFTPSNTSKISNQSGSKHLTKKT